MVGGIEADQQIRDLFPQSHHLSQADNYRNVRGSRHNEKSVELRHGFQTTEAETADEHFATTALQSIDVSSQSKS